MEFWWTWYSSRYVFLNILPLFFSSNFFKEKMKKYTSCSSCFMFSYSHFMVAFNPNSFQLFSSKFRKCCSNKTLGTGKYWWNISTIGSWSIFYINHCLAICRTITILWITSLCIFSFPTIWRLILTIFYTNTMNFIVCCANYYFDCYFGHFDPIVIFRCR